MGVSLTQTSDETISPTHPGQQPVKDSEGGARQMSEVREFQAEGTTCVKVLRWDLASKRKRKGKIG